MSKREDVILGIDPGFAITGFGVVRVADQKIELVDHGCITTEKGKLSDRLKIVHEDTAKLIAEHGPTAFSIEKIFFFKNLKTAIDVGHSRGVLLLAAKQAGLPIFEYTPLQIKQSLSGYGRADKEQVQKLVAQYLKLDYLPEPDDAADAIATALCHSHFKAYQEKVKIAQQ